MIALGSVKGHPMKEGMEFPSVSLCSLCELINNDNFKNRSNSRWNCEVKTVLVNIDHRRVSRFEDENRFASGQELPQNVNSGPSPPTLKREF